MLQLEGGNDGLNTVIPHRNDTYRRLRPQLRIATKDVKSIDAECGFHPEACAYGAGNQKGSVERLVHWVKTNFLLGRAFADDADLAAQLADWLAYANTRPSSATDAPPARLLAPRASLVAALRGDRKSVRAPFEARTRPFGWSSERQTVTASASSPSSWMV